MAAASTSETSPSSAVRSCRPAFGVLMSRVAVDAYGPALVVLGVFLIALYTVAGRIRA